MVKTAMALFFGILFASCVEANGDDWVSCRADSDCIKVSGPCGRSASINKARESVYQSHRKKNREVESCMEPSQDDLKADRNALAVCKTGRCELMAPEPKKP